MAELRVNVASPLSPAEAFARLTDLDGHTAAIPLTKLTHQPPLRKDSTFIARTAIGPIGFDDPMVVTEYAEPGTGSTGRIAFRKTGRWVLGSILCTVAAAPAGGSRISWQQNISIRWLPTWLDPFVARIAHFAYATAIRRLLRGDPGAI